MKLYWLSICLSSVILITGCTQGDKSTSQDSNADPAENQLMESPRGNIDLDFPSPGNEVESFSAEEGAPDNSTAAPSMTPTKKYYGGTRSGKGNSVPLKPVKNDIVRIYYGTNRDTTGSTDPASYYGNERDSLSIGFCDVSIPENHVEGEIERPKIWKLEFSENPNKHIVLLNIQPTDPESFLGQVHQSLDESEAREMFVFIHGYNVKFHDAALRTAQIAHDLKFDGVPMMFSWPAKGNVEDYTVDEATASWAKTDAYKFLLAMTKFSKAKKIHVIAHSMGNRVLAGALDQLSVQVSLGDSPRINQVILTAPDIDADIFRDDIAPRIKPSADRITIYASSNDRALKASRILHGNSRLGLSGSHLGIISLKHGIDIVDASEVDTSLFGHSY